MFEASSYLLSISVCLSVCLSVSLLNACIVIKRNNRLLERCSYVRCFMIDFSNRVSHPILLSKLSKLELPDRTINWIISYLTGCKEMSRSFSDPVVLYLYFLRSFLSCSSLHALSIFTVYMYVSYV